MTTTTRHSLPLLALVVLLLTGCHTPSHESADPKPAPSWESVDMDGNVVRSTDFAGKVILLDFWATWCTPCVEEIPGFIQLQKKYGGDGLVIIGADIGEEPAVVKAAMKKLGINYPIIASPSQLEEALGGVPAIPAAFIIDRQGNIVKHHEGFTSAATFEADIKPLLTPGSQGGASSQAKP